MKIVCYGDSNTYGWDPRYFSDGRYADPWPKLLSEKLDCNVVNLGEPGRMVLDSRQELEWYRRDIRKHNPDLLVIMLGTNDILTLPDASVDDVTQNMYRLVTDTIQNQLAKRILLLSCPQITAMRDTYLPLLADLSEKYKEIAEKEQISFADPFTWDIPMAYDGIHFSEEGHRVFAENLYETIRKTG